MAMPNHHHSISHHHLHSQSIQGLHGLHGLNHHLHNQSLNHPQNIHHSPKHGHVHSLQPSHHDTMKKDHHHKDDAMQLTCSSELIRRMNELREKREDLRKSLKREEEERANIQKDLVTLTRRLAEIDESLSKKYAYKNDYEKTIEEVEAAYSIIMQSSQTLLHVLKMEASEIMHKT